LHALSLALHQFCFTAGLDIFWISFQTCLFLRSRAGLDVIMLDEVHPLCYVDTNLGLLFFWHFRHLHANQGLLSTALVTADYLWKRPFSKETWPSKKAGVVSVWTVRLSVFAFSWQTSLFRGVQLALSGPPNARYTAPPESRLFCLFAVVCEPRRCCQTWHVRSRYNKGRIRNNGQVYTMSWLGFHSFRMPNNRIHRV
jgi:hypothetical protein